MAGKKQMGSSSSSSSSFTTDLFGAKESSSPSQSSTMGHFASIFPPPSMVVGKNFTTSEVTGSWQKQPSTNHLLNSKQGPSGSANRNVSNKEKNSVFQEERVEPCHFSSSIYYGGQDIYSHSTDTQVSGSHNPLVKKDGAEDDMNGNNLHSATWWQGSLYY